MKRIAVMISDSGTGSNLQAIIDNIKSKKIAAEIAVVVSDTKKAKGIDRAVKNDIPIAILSDNKSIIKLLNKYKIDYIALCGWKKIISDEFISSFENRILNIHPGLIPDKKNGAVLNPDSTIALWNRGKFTDKAIKNFLDKKSTYAGSTIHFLSHDFDFGQVLDRCFVKIKKSDDIDSLYFRLKKQEHKIYVGALARLCI